MSIEQIISVITNNGVSIGLLLYFVYRDNKFMNTLNTTLTTLRNTTESIKKMLEKRDTKWMELIYHSTTL